MSSNDGSNDANVEGRGSTRTQKRKQNRLRNRTKKAASQHEAGQRVPTSSSHVPLSRGDAGLPAYPVLPCPSNVPRY
ncbi:hypothetical protein BD777DRAFT_14791 [Yarrowia lipolytica]|nr:hypothetical protein BD777DRAFT_14791 [Yarrowia lipolytica]